jgi:hypothetical protein
MKNLFIVALLLFTFSSQAQTWGAKIENAQFQNSVNNHLAYTSEVKKTQGIFSDDDFQLISNRCLTKEGVFKLDISQDKSTIYIYYLDWIDQWTINWLFTEANPALDHKLRIHPGVEFTF